MTRQRSPRRTGAAAAVAGASVLTAAAVAQLLGGVAVAAPTTSPGATQSAPPLAGAGGPTAAPTTSTAPSSAAPAPSTPAPAPTSAAPSPSASSAAPSATGPSASSPAPSSAPSSGPPSPSGSTGAGTSTPRSGARSASHGPSGGKSNSGSPTGGNGGSKPAGESGPGPECGFDDEIIIEPDYGCGKITVEAKPVNDTFPGGQAPMGEGDNIAFQISSYYEPFEISELRATQKQPPSNTQSGTADCTTATVDPTDGDPAYDCPESVGPDGLTIFGGEGPQPWAAGTPVTISLNGTKPPNTLIPTVHVRHMPDCTDAAFGDGETTCADTVAVPVYGAYHRVVLNVTNRIVEEPIPDVKYELCGPTPNEGPLPTPTPTTTNTDLPPTGNASAPCPNNGEVLATGTSDENGNVDFGLFPGSEQYSAVPTHVPHGYFKGDFVEINVPQVTKAAEAGTTITQDTTLMPKPPKLQDQSVSTPENQSVTLNALEGATAVTNPLRLTGVGTPGHGTAHDPQGDVTYTPDEGYVGKDAFTYTATNGLGRSATATVHVTVTPVPKRHPTPGPSSGPGTKPHRGSAGGTSSAGAAAGTSTVSEPSGALPFTGENATRDGAVGLLALATGSLLVVTGRRRRRAGR